MLRTLREAEGSENVAIRVDEPILVHFALGGEHGLGLRFSWQGACSCAPYHDIPVRVALKKRSLSFFLDD